MSKKFFLPDLGEGLPDATIVEWHVNVGDVIRLDENLVSMETAKAVVDVPSPVSGKVLALAGGAGDVIITGAWLAEFEVDPSLPQRAEGQDTGHHHGASHAAPATPAAPAPAAKAEPEDAGTVVGAMQVGNAVIAESALAVGGVKAVPAVRAMARKLGVDLARVAPTGADGTVSMADVKAAAANPATLRTAAPATVAAPPVVAAAAPAPAQRSTLSQAGKPMRTQPPGVAASGQPEQLKGVRRNMARVMADAHAKVVPTTLVDDADLHAWIGKQDITARLIRAIVTACKTVPAPNRRAWPPPASPSSSRACAATWPGSWPMRTARWYRPRWSTMPTCTAGSASRTSPHAWSARSRSPARRCPRSTPGSMATRWR